MASLSFFDETIINTHLTSEKYTAQNWLFFTSPVRVPPWRHLNYWEYNNRLPLLNSSYKSEAKAAKSY
jgi:hypothetical protein